MDLIQEHTSLLSGLVFDQVHAYNDYIVAQSFIQQDRDWNQIIPLVDLPSLRKADVDQFIKGMEAEGWYFSYYVKNELLPSYADMLATAGYKHLLADTFLKKVITAESPTSLADKEIFAEVGNDDLQQYIDLDKQAFEGWENAEAYTRKFYNYGREAAGKQLRNFMIKRGEVIICFGSMIYSPKLNVAYLHNSGTNILFRRQGYFVLLKKLMMNYLLQQKVTNVYVIVEEGGASQVALNGLGFEKADQYHIFSNRV